MNKSTGGPFENTAPPKELDWNFWLGQAPKVPYCPERCNYNFRWWLEYSGGQVTDWGVHHTDIAIWALGGGAAGVVQIEGSGDYPRLTGKDTAEFLNGRSTISNGYNVARNFDCRLQLNNGNSIQLISGKNELIIAGEKGRIRVNRGGLTGQPIEQLSAKEQEALDEQIIGLCHGKKPGNHMANFFECVRDRSLPISDVFSHVQSVDACHMANIAMILGRKLTWDPTNRVFVDDPAANQFIKREQREGFEIKV